MTALGIFAISFIQAKRIYLFLIASLFLLGILGSGTPTAHAQGFALSLVWSDEFNSATASNVDTTKWTFDTGNNNGWGNDELEFYTRRTNNAFVAGGLLHIHAQIETTNSISHNVTNVFHYTSARMKSQGLFNTLYGRIEWRAKLPAGTGMWPALWMMGSNSVSVPWPGCGEIDVVENNGADVTFVQGSLHSGTDETLTYTLPGSGSVADFHVYDLDWISNSITWSVDGVAYETQTSWGTSVSGKSYPYPFNQPFYILMNLATGGDYVNNPDTNSINASLPNELQVDYIRVYQFVPVINPLITQISPTNGCASGGTHITISGANFQSGSTITMNGVNATAVTFVNSNTLTAITSANTPGAYSVVVKTPLKPPTTLTNGFTCVGAPLFAGPGGVTPAINGATLSWSAASGGMAPLAYNVSEGTNSGGESALLGTNALSVFLPLFPGSNSAITYFFKVNATDGCSASDTNQVELSVQPLLDPDASQVGDGIPNSWKLQYGFNPFDPTVAAADPDGDGLSNLQEFELGTDPTDPTSPFHVTSVTMNGTDMLINWMSVGGMTNAVESASDPGATWSNISGNIILTGVGLTTTNYTDPGAATNYPANYYHIRLVP